MHCTQCGTLIEPTDKFCGGCGAPVKAPSSAEKEPPQEQGDDTAREPGYKCPKCSEKVTYVEQYQKYWCDKCQTYPEFKEGPQEPGSGEYEVNCSECGTKVDYVEQYQQYWCPKCQKYVTPYYPPAQPVTPEEAPPDEPSKTAKPKKDKANAWEEDDDAKDEKVATKTTKCPKCKANVKIPFSQSKKIRIECSKCGVKGKVANPYLK